MSDPAQERIDAHLDTQDEQDEQDAAAEWTPETIYDPRPFKLWWHGLMTYDEYRAHQIKIAALKDDYNRREDERTFRLMAEMGW